MNEFLTKNSTNIIEQPPYSPDMVPVDFFLFPKLKSPLRGTRCQSIEIIKENSRRELKSIPENAFKKCFDDWIIRWHKCIISGGTYFEGDKINLDDNNNNNFFFHFRHSTLKKMVSKTNFGL